MLYDKKLRMCLLGEAKNSDKQRDGQRAVK